MTVIVYPNNTVSLRDERGNRVNKEDWTLNALTEYLSKFCEFVDIAKERKGDLENPVHVSVSKHEIVIYNNVGYTEEELVEIRRQRVIEYDRFCRQERARSRQNGSGVSRVGKGEKLVSMATEIAKTNGGEVTIDDVMKYMWSMNNVLEGRKKIVRTSIEERLKRHGGEIEKVATNTYRLKSFS